MNPLLLGRAVPVAGKSFRLMNVQFPLPTSDQRATHPSTPPSRRTTVALFRHYGDGFSLKFWTVMPA
jgi:hypothetical protein